MKPPATLLILPSALADLRGQDEFRDIVQNRNGIVLAGSNPIADTARDMIGVREFEFMRVRLGAGAYRHDRGNDGSSPGAYDRMTLGRTRRLADSVLDIAGRLGITTQYRQDEPQPIREIQWSVPIHDEADRNRLRALDSDTTLAHRIEAVVHGKIVDADTLRILHEAMAAIMSAHVGDDEVASFMPSTPSSPARMDASGGIPGGIVGAIAAREKWRSIDIDPKLARLIPSVLLVDLDDRRSLGGTRSVWLRPVMTTMARWKRFDPMRTLRILSQLEQKPLA